MNRCLKCRTIFDHSLTVQSPAGPRCPICYDNDLIEMSPGFDATKPCHTGHVVPANHDQYRELIADSVLIASEDGVDYYYSPFHREWIAVLPGGVIAAGGREFKSGPVQRARAIYREILTRANGDTP